MRRKSDEQKKLQGTDRYDRQLSSVENPAENPTQDPPQDPPQPPAKKFTGRIPTPVIALSKKAKKWYTTICKELIEVDGFISPDSIIVAQFCKALDLYIDVASRLNSADDCVQIYKNGTSNISGDFVAFGKLNKTLSDLAPQIGIGVKARQNVTQFISNQLTMQFGQDTWSEVRKTIPIKSK